MGEVLYRPVVEVIAGVGGGQPRRGVARECADGGGPDPFTCWSAKPIHIGEWRLMNSANGSADRSATSRGNPICTNMCLEEVNFISPRQAGERTEWPCKRLLPPNHASTSWRNPELSLRSVNSRSLCADRAAFLDKLSTFMPAGFYYKTFLWPRWETLRAAFARWPDSAASIRTIVRRPTIRRSMRAATFSWSARGRRVRRGQRRSAGGTHSHPRRRPRRNRRSAGPSRRRDRGREAGGIGR